MRQQELPSYYWVPTSNTKYYIKRRLLMDFVFGKVLVADFVVLFGGGGGGVSVHLKDSFKKFPELFKTIGERERERKRENNEWKTTWTLPKAPPQGWLLG